MAGRERHHDEPGDVSPEERRGDIYVATVEPPAGATLVTQEMDGGTNIDWWVSPNGKRRLAGVEVLGAGWVSVDGRTVFRNRGRL